MRVQDVRASSLVCTEGAGLSLKLTYLPTGGEGSYSSLLGLVSHLGSFASPFPAPSSGNLCSPALWAMGPQLKVHGWSTQGFMKCGILQNMCNFWEETAWPILAP